VTLRLRGETTITAHDFAPAFLIVAAISALSAPIFWRLPDNAGAELADRAPAPTEPSDQRVG